MTYYGGKELAAAFRTVRGNTIKVASEIPEEQYDFKASPDVRSIRDTLAHVALSTFFPTHVHTNKIDDMKSINFQELMATMTAEQARSRSKAEIIELLQTDGEAFAAFLEGMSDAFLAETVTMMPGGQPPVKSRFEMLLGAKEHEMHHRGQLMLMERMIGIVPHLTRDFQERVARMQAAQARG
ncbi:MAG: DinB family protein [Acidobacteriota bacterium]